MNTLFQALHRLKLEFEQSSLKRHTESILELRVGHQTWRIQKEPLVPIHGVPRHAPIPDNLFYVTSLLVTHPASHDAVTGTRSFTERILTWEQIVHECIFTTFIQALDTGGSASSGDVHAWDGPVKSETSAAAGLGSKTSDGKEPQQHELATPTTPLHLSMRQRSADANSYEQTASLPPTASVSSTPVQPFTDGAPVSAQQRPVPLGSVPSQPHTMTPDMHSMGMHLMPFGGQSYFVPIGPAPPLTPTMPGVLSLPMMHGGSSSMYPILSSAATTDGHPPSRNGAGPAVPVSPTSPYYKPAPTSGGVMSGGSDSPTAFRPLHEPAAAATSDVSVRGSVGMVSGTAERPHRVLDTASKASDTASKASYTASKASATSSISLMHGAAGTVMTATITSATTATPPSTGFSTAPARTAARTTAPPNNFAATSLSTPNGAARDTARDPTHNPARPVTILRAKAAATTTGGDKQKPLVNAVAPVVVATSTAPVPNTNKSPPAPIGTAASKGPARVQTVWGQLRDMTATAPNDSTRPEVATSKPAPTIAAVTTAASAVTAAAATATIKPNGVVTTNQITGGGSDGVRGATMDAGKPRMDKSQRGKGTDAGSGRALCIICDEEVHTMKECLSDNTHPCQEFFDTGKCTRHECNDYHDQASESREWVFRVVCGVAEGPAMLGCLDRHQPHRCPHMYCDLCASTSHWQEQCTVGRFCVFCKSAEHRSDACPSKRLCTACGKSDHWRVMCPERKCSRPRCKHQASWPHWIEHCPSRYCRKCDSYSHWLTACSVKNVKTKSTTSSVTTATAPPVNGGDTTRKDTTTEHRPRGCRHCASVMHKSVNCPKRECGYCGEYHLHVHCPVRKHIRESGHFALPWSDQRNDDDKGDLYDDGDNEDGGQSTTAPPTAATSRAITEVAPVSTSRH